MFFGKKNQNLKKGSKCSSENLQPFRNSSGLVGDNFFGNQTCMFKKCLSFLKLKLKLY